MVRRRSRGAPRAGLLVVLVAMSAMLGLAACRSTAGQRAGSTTTSTSAPTLALNQVCGLRAAPPPRYDHVVMVVEENRTWAGGRSPGVGMGFSSTTMPYLHGLARQCSYYTDWYETNGDQNSLNQYVGLTSGVASSSTVNDCLPSPTCRSIDDNVFRQIRTAGGTPRSFVDGATTPCSTGTNAAKHIPALYFQGGDDANHCRDEVRPLPELDPNRLPTLAFVVPDLCHDGHDCPDDQVDAFAAQILKPILAGADYRAGRTLIVVVYDEDRPVPNLLIAPTADPGPISSIAGSHADLLKTVEEALGLRILDQGQLPTATSLRPSAHI